MSHNTNIVRLKAVANALMELNQDVVFVGGATVSLYANPDVAPEARPTDDVDVIIELASYADYAKLEERLRQIGFINDITSGVICRYKIQGIIVDIMPTAPEPLGFSNKWYSEGFQNAINYSLDGDTIIKIFSIPYFIASKLEAFKSRGKGDYRTSSDFEDIIYVFENGLEVKSHLKEANENIHNYLREEFTLLLKDESFEEGLYAHLEFYTANEKSSEIIRILQELYL